MTGDYTAGSGGVGRLVDLSGDKVNPFVRVSHASAVQYSVGSVGVHENSPVISTNRLAVDVYYASKQSPDSPARGTQTVRNFIFIPGVSRPLKVVFRSYFFKKQNVPCSVFRS